MQESISFDKDLRKAIKKTLKTLGKAVKSTLGPSGTNVGTLSGIMLPVIVNDGVTVAKKVNFKDPLKKYIANILKTVSQNTDNIAGDGTTTATTLLEAIVLAGIKNIEAEFSQIDIVIGIREATLLVLKQLEKKTTYVKGDKNLLLQVATISANNDKELGDLISKAFIQVGVDGQIEVKDSTKEKTYVDILKGVKYDSGYESNLFTNNDKGEAILDDCKILIYEGKLTSIDPILDVLRDTRNENTSLLVIADDYSKEAVDDLSHNKINAKLKVCAVKSPQYGKAKEASLEDIADVTDTKIVSRRFGRDLETFSTEYLGFATTVKVNSDSFIIINDNVDQKVIADKVKKLKLDVKKTNGTEKDELQSRIAKLSDGIAVLFVHGNSPVEIAEKKYRIEDAINATRASLEEGIVPGGGVTLLRLGNGLKMPKMKNRAQEIGFNILVEALESPIRTICNNSGASEDVVVNNVLQENQFNYGYDARLKIYGDLIELGIIDPKKVTKTALVNASSVAQMILTMNCAIYE